MSEEEINEFFATYDANKDGSVSKQEYLDWFSSMLGQWEKENGEKCKEN